MIDELFHPVDSPCISLLINLPQEALEEFVEVECTRVVTEVLEVVEWP